MWSYKRGCRMLGYSIAVLGLFFSVASSQREECREAGDCTSHDNSTSIYCCAYGCCSENEFAAQSCFFNFNCPRTRMDESQKFCCSNGCCEDAQYNSGTCTTDSDCPGNNTEYSVLHTKCCASGCCTPYVYNLPQFCTEHSDCPGRYGQREEEFCCGNRCCNEEYYDAKIKYCTDDHNCDDISENEFCCDGMCCHPQGRGKTAAIVVGSVVAFVIAIVCCCGIRTKIQDFREQNEKKTRRRVGYSPGTSNSNVKLT